MVDSATLTADGSRLQISGRVITTEDIAVIRELITENPLRDWLSVDMNYPYAAGVRPLPAFARVLDHQSITQYKYKGIYVRAEKRFARRY